MSAATNNSIRRRKNTPSRADVVQGTLLVRHGHPTPYLIQGNKHRHRCGFCSPHWKLRTAITASPGSRKNIPIRAHDLVLSQPLNQPLKPVVACKYNEADLLSGSPTRCRNEVDILSICTMSGPARTWAVMIVRTLLIRVVLKGSSMPQRRQSSKT